MGCRVYGGLVDTFVPIADRRVYGGLVLIRRTGTRSLRNIVYGGLVLGL